MTNLARNAFPKQIDSSSNKANTHGIEDLSRSTPPKSEACMDKQDTDQSESEDSERVLSSLSEGSKKSPLKVAKEARGAVKGAQVEPDHQKSSKVGKRKAEATYDDDDEEDSIEEEVKKRRKRAPSSKTSEYAFSEMHELDSGLATVEGQLAENPHFTEEQAKTAAKREYNRRNAARARIRNKTMVKDLQKKVNDLTEFAEELQRKNEVLQARLDVVTKQNEELVASRDQKSAPPPAAGSTFAASADVMGLLQARQENSMVGGGPITSQLLAHALAQQAPQNQARLSFANTLAAQRGSSQPEDASAQLRALLAYQTPGASAFDSQFVHLPAGSTEDQLLGGARGQDHNFVQLLHGLPTHGTPSQQAVLLASASPGRTGISVRADPSATNRSLGSAGQLYSHSDILGNLSPQALYSIIRSRQSHPTQHPPPGPPGPSDP